MKIDAKEKTKLEQRLVLSIIDGHRKGDFGYLQMKKSAVYILNHIDNAENQQELIHFLHNLSARWSLFEPIYEDERKRLKN
jgi:hypothetical protein